MNLRRAINVYFQQELAYRRERHQRRRRPPGQRAERRVVLGHHRQAGVQLGILQAGDRGEFGADAREIVGDQEARDLFTAVAAAKPRRTKSRGGSAGAAWRSS